MYTVCPAACTSWIVNSEESCAEDGLFVGPNVTVKWAWQGWWSTAACTTDYSVGHPSAIIHHRHHHHHQGCSVGTSTRYKINQTVAPKSKPITVIMRAINPRGDLFATSPKYVLL